MWLGADMLRVVALLAYSVIPNATERVWKSLGQNGSVGEQGIDALEFGTIKPGVKIAKAETLFPRVEKQEAVERMEAMESEPQKPVAEPPASGGTVASPSVAAPQTAPEKIAIQDFPQVDMH